MLKLGRIDFGPTDARHIIFSSERDQELFRRVFITPANLDLERFLDGRKSIVYGIKGSGKSAWLKFLEITVRTSAKTKFFYFRKETDKFFDEVIDGPLSQDAISKAEGIKKTEVRDFWRLFIILSVANQLFDDYSPQARSFVGLVRKFIQRQASWVSSLLNKVPILNTFVAKINAQSEIELTGEFKDRPIERLDDEILFSLLGERSSQKPIYIFFDEMEIVFTSTERFNSEVILISGLIECIRDLNELFRKVGAKIYLITAVRKEISDNIIGGDISKIVNDLGQEVAWHRRSWSKQNRDYVHPLFEIILKRIAFSEDALRADLPKIVERGILEERFPKFIKSGNVQKDILDLTMYRPRDCALLMGICGNIDKDLQRFRKETFLLDFRAQFGNRIWVDIQEALSSKYDKPAIKGLRVILSASGPKFTIPGFFQKIDECSYDPDVSVVADAGTAFWIGILKDLFEIGAIGNIGEDGKFRFRFRGQNNLDIRPSGVIIIHQSLLSELS